MCGISGIVSNRQELDKLSLVKKMSDTLSHRGPDGEGYWVNPTGHVAFGHRRLSIIDLSDKGHQPMRYAEGRFTIVFNGEIYNYIELRDFLINRGYTFESRCDTEVILALYEFKGTGCLEDLNGMFSFAIWDEHEQTLFCARDRFGEKPFFYHFNPANGFYFASEIKAFWSVGLSRNLDEQSVADYLHTNALNSPNDPESTFFKDIRQLDSGHFLLLTDTNKIRITKYYSLDEVKKNDAISEADAAGHLLNMLTESVRLRLRSDVAVGSSLSGGLDSSTIVALIDRMKKSGSVQKTFSARFRNFDKDEGHYIHKVVDSCKEIANHEVWPTHEELIEDIDRLIYHQDEPFGSASIFAQWKVMELAKREKVTVLLDGQGADEYLAGYLPYYQLYLNELYYNQRALYHDELRKYNGLRQSGVITQHQSIRQRIGRVRRKLAGQKIPFTTGSLRSQLKADTLVDGLKVLLRYADRNSMAHSREVRLPFLDHKVVEFVFSLPDNYLLRDGWTKWILRQSITGILPAEIVWRVEKVGFEPPEADWLLKIMNDKMKKNVQKFLLDKKIARRQTEANDISDWKYFILNKMIN